LLFPLDLAGQAVPDAGRLEAVGALVGEFVRLARVRERRGRPEATPEIRDLNVIAHRAVAAHLEDVGEVTAQRIPGEVRSPEQDGRGEPREAVAGDNKATTGAKPGLVVAIPPLLDVAYVHVETQVFGEHRPGLCRKRGDAAAVLLAEWALRR